MLLLVGVGVGCVGGRQAGGSRVVGTSCGGARGVSSQGPRHRGSAGVSIPAGEDKNVGHTDHRLPCAASESGGLGWHGLPLCGPPLPAWRLEVGVGLCLAGDWLLEAQFTG